ncbi:hypothetical protein ACLVWU_12280 [Bdellovibrio sp. HCB290]|uniref:hypothetical protein n=1 Tax=Bdellovibrio sp. HCB290 TaxID=3394356 RepID=UPI0039B51BA3
MHFLLAVLLIINPAYAHSEVSGQATVFYTPLESSTISAGDYEDIRVDADRDQKIDLWVLRKGPTSITLKFKDGRISSMHIRKFVGGKVQEAQYSYNGRSLTLASSELRAPLIMNGSDETLKCAKENDGVLAELAKFTGGVNAKQSLMAVEEAVACDNEDVTPVLTTTLNAVVTDNSMSECLRSPKMLSKVAPEDKGLFIYLSNKLKLDLSKISHQVDSKGLLSCEVSADAKVPKGKYQEGGGITITVPKGMEPTDSNGVAAVIYHELLHRTGVIDEKTVDQVLAVCPAKAMEKTGSAQAAQAVIATNPSKSLDNTASKAKTKVATESKRATAQKQKRQVASSASETGGGSEGYNMAKEISSAEVQQSVPSSEKLAVNKINMTDEGKAQAVAASERQSAPVFAMADRAMGVMNTPALANDDSSSSGYSSASTSTSSSSSSSRSSSDSGRSSSGERYQARHGRYESETSDSKSSGSKSNSISLAYKPSKQGRDEQVVREVDLTKGAIPSTETGSSTSARGTNSRTVASAAITDEVSDAARIDGAGAGSGSRSAAGSGSGSGTYYANGNSSNTRKTNAQTRSTASLPPTALPEKYGTRDRVLDQFSGSSHSQVKSLIKSDSDFKRALETYEIKVVDSYGGVYGSSTGKTIYSDTGSEFLMIRRK